MWGWGVGGDREGNNGSMMVHTCVCCVCVCVCVCFVFFFFFFCVCVCVHLIAAPHFGGTPFTPPPPPHKNTNSWDEVCCEADEWQAVANVAALQNGVAQPFYHILVDMRDWPSARFEAPVAYVAEELLDAPQEPATWVQVHGKDEFQHPYTYLLFLGVDGAGDFLPVQQLRDKFSVARRDVYAPGEGDAAEDEEEEEGGDDDTDGPTP